MPRVVRSSVLISLGLSIPAIAGIMRHDIPVQTYRDFAENRGIFAAGATDVPVYRSDGTLSGVISRVPDFGGISDSPGLVTAIDPGFAVTAWHTKEVTSGRKYGDRHNLSGLPFSTFGDSYRVISSHWLDLHDFAVVRHAKIYLETTPYPLATPQSTGTQYFRAGGGTQSVATLPVGETVLDSGWLTAGTNRIDAVYSLNYTSATPMLTGSFPGYRYASGITSTQDSPLELFQRSGDSGTPMLVWNPSASRFELAGVVVSGSGEGYAASGLLRTAPQFATALMASYESPPVLDISGTGLTIGIANTNGSGSITQGTTTWGYTGLAAGLSSTTATDAQLDAARNLIFRGAGNTVTLAGTVDLGAGSITFENNGTYTLADGGDTTRRLRSAGYLVNGTTTLVSKLTGSAGDDWRKLGTGTLRIEGYGANSADLSLGDGITELGRTVSSSNATGTSAARNVRLVSGRATVRLLADNQFSGDVIFGFRGGKLDLWGRNLTDSAITHFDGGAHIANTKTNTTSVFTFNGTGTQTYRGRFSDGGSLAAGLLKVAYSGGSNNTWTLAGDISHRGGFDVGSNGKVILDGGFTLHANNYTDQTDYMPVTFSAGSSAVNLAAGSSFTLKRKATATGAFVVADTGTLGIAPSGGLLRDTQQGTDEGGLVSGTVNLAGTASKLSAAPAAGFTATVTANLSGSGLIEKTGTGILRITGTNTHTGINLVSAGTVSAATTSALGSGTNKWSLTAAGALAIDGASIATALPYLKTDSTGTLALSGNDTAPVATPSHTALYIGAIAGQSAHIGTTGSDLPATGTAWKLGGGGGELVVDSRLTGSNTLYVGNGSTTGILRLTNPANDFTGGIVFGGGVELRYDSLAALGSQPVDLAYGKSIGMGTDLPGLLAKLTASSSGYLAIREGTTSSAAIDLTTRPDLALGASPGSAATFSGSITPGSGGYRFGGSGSLTVTTALSGAANLTIDGQGLRDGVITLNTPCTLTGAVLIQGANTGSGTIWLRLGADEALGSGISGLTMRSGGILDLAGHTLTPPMIDSANGSVFTNTSSTPATLVIDQSTGTTTLSGAFSTSNGRIINITKRGASTLTLPNVNYHSGTLSIEGGTVLLGSAQAVGASNSNVIINSGTVLDLQGTALIMPVTLNGGTLRSTSSSTSLTTINSPFAIATGGGTIDLSGYAGNATLSGAVAGSTPLSITGRTAKTLTLSAANPYNGDLTFSNGTLSITGSLGNGTYSGNLTISTGAAVSFSPATDTTQVVSGSIAGSGELRKTGAGTLRLTGANGHTGGTTVSQGILITGNTSALGSGAGNTSITSTGTLVLGDGTSNTVTLGNDARLSMSASSAKLRLGAANSTIQLTGAGGFSLTGGTIDLNGVFDSLAITSSHKLITGGTGTKSTSGITVTGYSTSVFTNVTFSIINGEGVLTFTSALTPYQQWLTQYPTLADTSPGADPDGDGFTNAMEFSARTHPGDSTSALRVSSMSRNAAGDEITLSWQSVSGVTYQMQSSPDLRSWTPLGNNITAGAAITSATRSIPGSHRFFRVATTP